MSLELLRDNEKAEVRKMISVLADYGLSYVPEAAAKGDSGSAGGHSSSLPHILVPEIDQFVGFRVEEESTPRGSVLRRCDVFPRASSDGGGSPKPTRHHLLRRPHSECPSLDGCSRNRYRKDPPAGKPSRGSQSLK